MGSNGACSSSPSAVRSDSPKPQHHSSPSLGPERGAPLPMVLSMTNGYFGYVASRWEYENREHYRQSMTFFGPGTADHIASFVVALAREMQGGAAARFLEQPWHEVDREGAGVMGEWLASLDETVAEMSRQLPASEPERVGTCSTGPPSTRRTGGCGSRGPAGPTTSSRRGSRWSDRPRPAGDHDGDGLSNIEAYLHGTCL